jgi:hypothetical protein
MSRTLRIDETGNRYGRLVVTGVVDRPLESRIRRSKAKWFCRCDCGETTAVFGDKLRNGHIKNCLTCERAWRNRPK